MGIDEDLKRAHEALDAAERNFKEGDMLTAANRVFVACENAVYILLKLKFGSVSVSRMRILTRLGDIDLNARTTYDTTYDLRVQADYGKEAKILPLTKENLSKTLNDVRQLVEKAEREMQSLKQYSKRNK